MKASGKITIEEGLVLNSPNMEIVNISYPQRSNEVIVECYFNEEGAEFKHSRSFKLDNAAGGQMTKPDVLTLVKEHPILKQFS
jgi:hypothetical protein